MKKYLLTLLLSALYVTSFAQTSRIDSLRTALSAATDTNQIAVLFQLYQTFRRAEQWDSCLMYAQKARTKAEILNGSLSLSGALSRLADTHFSMNDSLKGSQFREMHREVASSYGIKLDRDYGFNMLEFYRYSISTITSSLRIYQDTLGLLTYEQIKKLPFQLNNTPESFDPNGIYWIQLKVTGHEDQAGKPKGTGLGKKADHTVRTEGLFTQP